MLARNAYSAELADPASPSDHNLVAAIRRGDDRAFECLYERYRRRIHAYVAGMCKDHGRAEDITQEVFVAALRRMRATERPIAFKPWIYEIAKNACIDQHRRASRTEEISLQADEGLAPADYGRLVGADPTPDAAVEVKQDLDDLCGAFGGLSETHHDILVMRELEGLSYREIGERMGMSRPAVESTLFRARRRLTEEYEELVSGQRCVRIQGIIAIAGEAGGKVGSRDTRRLARHVAHCQPCRREAIAAGLDAAVLTLPRHKVAAKVAALLPFPPLGRRWGRGAGTGDRDGWILQLGSMSDHAGPGWAKAAAAAALLLAGAGAGVKVATDAGGAPSHAAARPAQSAGAPSGGGGAAALGAPAVRTSGAGSANRLASRVERRGATGGTSGHAGSAAPTGAVQSGPSSPAAPRPAAATTGPGAGTSGSRTTTTVRDTASGASDTVQAAVGAATGAVSGAAGAVPVAADAATGAAAGTAGTLESVAGDATGAVGNVPPITP